MAGLPLGRRGAKKVLFYAESPVKYAMFRPLHERLLADDRVEVYFAGQLRGRASSAAMAEILGIRRIRTLPRGLAALHRFDLLIQADYELWRPYRHPRLPIAKTPRVQLFHGASVRNGAVHPKVRRFQHLFVVGPYMHRAFAATGMFPADDPRLRPIGMPKTDRLIDGSLDDAKVRAALRLDDGPGRRKVVMLAPTWLLKTPMHRYGVAMIEALLALPIQLLVKLHDKFFDARFNNVDWRQRLAPFAVRENCRVLTDYDAIPAMKVTDLLISDVSSIANEFALLDRPLVYLKVDAPDWLLEQYPRLDLDTWGQKAGAVVASAGECSEAVAHALAHPGERGEVRRALAADVFYHPGRATDAAMRALYELLELEPAQVAATAT